ncbi:MAG: isoamylase early set domain-containing protein [Gemmatimonadales bacterium]
MAVERMEESDELIERAARALRTLPSPDPLATARILAAVRARRAKAPSRLGIVLEWMQEPSLSLASAGFLAAAALVVGFVTRGAITALNAPSQDAPIALAPIASPAAPGTMTSAAGTAGAVRAVPVLIAFAEAREAQRVSIVGDFNNWDAAASPMQRVGPGGPWTATVLAKPGRHVYAFLVDGTTLVADPRAPRALDLDYGGDASVLMVVSP